MILVHLAAIAREAGVAGFGQMMRVLVAETPEADPEWLREYGVPACSHRWATHSTTSPTVAGSLKENLPPAPPAPGERSRLVFVRARASGAEGVCRVRKGVTEPAGECRVFGSEEEAVSSVLRGEIEEWSVARGGRLRAARRPWTLRLDALGRSLKESGLRCL